MKKSNKGTHTHIHIHIWEGRGKVFKERTHESKARSLSLRYSHYGIRRWRSEKGEGGRKRGKMRVMAVTSSTALRTLPSTPPQRMREREREKEENHAGA